MYSDYSAIIHHREYRVLQFYINQEKIVLGRESRIKDTITLLQVTKHIHNLVSNFKLYIYFI